ncbi:MAG: redoxin domain-containing protein [Candidatus Thiodiazotropha sp. (ex Epidulcina cf. delphinae)]|nr:redoxin domain-containing protein [Candidatus Thiodiazotropha sp. (ex Epidulcina cf. delphinae)]
MYYCDRLFKNCSLIGFISFLCIVFLSACSAETPQSEKDQGKTNKLSSPVIEFAPGLSWLNVERPLTFDDLKGKMVILDFWTYGCINCIHVLADLKKLEEKYGDQLLVIGVHTPKFDNEKNIETLRKFVVRSGIEHPVVNDIDSVLGSYYGMRAWPTRVLIDPAGSVLGRVTGEGKYDLFDQTISQLLEEHQAILDPTPIPHRLERERLDASLLAAPGKIATSRRYVAISDTLHNRIVVTDHQGRIQQVFGGKTAGKQDGSNPNARFNMPQGVVFDENGIYVADTGNHLIRYIDLTTGSVRTVAGNGKLERKRQGVYDADSVGLASPWALALDNDQLYIAMAGSHQVWRYDKATAKISPFAGSGREGIDDGDLHKATFSQPSGLSLDGDWLYVADAEDSAIRRIQLLEERVETLVGTGLFDFGDRDGELQRAKLQHVLGIAVLKTGRLLVADTYNHKLKAIDLEKGVVQTLVGDGRPGMQSRVDGQVRLNEPGGLALLDGKVLIADTNNHRIVSYDPTSGVARLWPLVINPATK